MSEVLFTVRIVGTVKEIFQLGISLFSGKSLILGKNKAGRLPLSDLPSRFLSYPKIPLSGKVLKFNDRVKVVKTCVVKSKSYFF